MLPAPIPEDLDRRLLARVLQPVVRRRAIANQFFGRVLENLVQ